MEIAITWLQYALIIAIALTIYYLVLAILYYRKELLNDAVKKEKRPLINSSVADASTQSEEHFDTFFHNQIEDNKYDYNEGENEMNDQEDFEQKAEQGKPVDEASNIPHNSPEAQTEQNTFEQRSTPLVEQADDTIQQMEELSSRLTEAIAIAADKNYSKDELILSLKQLLQKHSFLKGLSHTELINNLIASECEKYGCVQLSAEEQVMLWNE